VLNALGGSRAGSEDEKVKLIVKYKNTDGAATAASYDSTAAPGGHGGANVCLYRAFTELCESYPNSEVVACLQSPDGFLRERMVSEYKPKANNEKLKEIVARKKSHGEAVRLVIGSGAKDVGLCGEGSNGIQTNSVQNHWVCSDRGGFDLVLAADWFHTLKGVGADNFFAEHVLEHFTPMQVEAVAANAFPLMKPGGTFRIAVLDGFKPESWYSQYIKAGSTPSNEGQNHMVAWTIDTLAPIFTKMGFQVIKQEYYDMQGNFHANDGHQYEDESTFGYVRRSQKHDSRNQGVLKTNYTSLWFDAHKPADCPSW